MSLTLVLNASEGRLQIVLARERDMLCAQEWAVPARGAEILAPAVSSICGALLCAPSDISRVACVRGPGSFTGIRLILTFAAAFKRANKALLAGLDYMRLLAFGAREELEEGDVVWALTHARRDLLHCQCFSHAIEPVSAIELLSPQDVAGRVGRGFVLGSGLDRHRDLFSRCCPEARLLSPRFNNPVPEDLLAWAREADFGSDDLEPLYVRPCDAVENFADIIKKSGRDLAASQIKLNRLLG